VPVSTPDPSGNDSRAGRATTTTTTSPPGTSEDESFDDETVERARSVGIAARSSVLVLTDDEDQPHGPGWYYDAEDVVVTAGHVYDSGGDLTGWLPDGTRVPLEQLGTGFREEGDVAGASTSVTRTPLPAGDPEDLDEGQPLVALGHPGDVGYWYISLGRFEGYNPRTDTLLSSIPSIGGFSGGPTLTLDGAVVGMLVGLQDADGARTVYGPDDRTAPPPRHEGIDTVTELVEEWTDG